jgi:hypothetical protein
MMTGAFRHYVDVFARGDQRDATTGQVVGSPSAKLRSVPCSIEVVTAGEVRRGQQMQATVDKLVTMRFIADVSKVPTTDDQLVEMHGDKVAQRINVVSAYDPDGRRRELLVQGRSAA